MNVCSLCRSIIVSLLLLIPITGYTRDNKPAYIEAAKAIQTGVYKQTGLEEYTKKAIKLMEKKAKNEAREQGLEFMVAPIVFVVSTAYRQELQLNYKNFRYNANREKLSLTFEVQF